MQSSAPMARRRRSGTETVAQAGHLVRSEAWAGLHPGDAVDVVGLGRRAVSFTFLAHVRNARSGDEWVEVVGGRAGERTVRSFAPDRIFAAGAARRGRPSLAEEPQLPFA